MSASQGERACALVHAGIGLQTRIYRLGTLLAANKLSYFKDSELEKVRRALDKYFPKRDAATKEKGWERMSDSALSRVFMGELVNGYETLKDCMRFRDAVLPALRQTASSIVRDPMKTSRPIEEQFWPAAASRAFLDLIAIYAKLSVQIEKLGPDLRALVNGYNAAHATVNGADDADYEKVASYLKLFEEGHGAGPGKDHSSILRSIALECMENGDTTIVDMISYLMETVRPWFLATATVTANVWTTWTAAACVLADPPAAPADITKCAPVCHRERARGWIIWCFLACPGALASSRSRYSEYARHDSLLKVVLTENVVEPVFRDVVIRLHEEYHELFSWFPAKCVSPAIKEAFEEFFVASKNGKKFVRDCSMECTNRAALVHRERRVMLAQMLLNATYQLQSSPALLGPKGASAVALLATTRDELTWYFAHAGQAPPKIHSTGLSMGGFFGGGENVKYVKEDWLDGVRVGTLLSCHARLFDQVRSLWWILERFMFETLKGPDYVECKNRGLTEHAEMLQRLQAPPSSEISTFLHEAHLLELRYETTQRPATVSMYSASSSYGDFFLPRLFFHLQLLGDGYVGGDGENDAGGFTDPEALRTFGSVGSLFFFQSVFMDAFEETLGAQARHCLGFLDTLSSVQDALHPYAPEDEQWLGERTSTLAETLLKRIQDRLNASLDELALRRAELDAQTDPIRAAERLSRLRERKLAKKGAGSKERPETGLNRLDRRPGFESRPSAREDVAALASAQRAVRGIAASFGRRANGTVLVWRRGYVLREFFRESLVRWLERRLKSKCAGGPTIPRPCIILEQCLQSFEVAKFACEHAGFDAAHFIRQAWVRETSGEPGTVADLIGQWLLKFLDVNLCAPGSSIVFSELTRGFVKAQELDSQVPGVAPPSPANAMRAEMWLDQVEVHALAGFLGRRGIAALVRLLKLFTAERMASLKRWLFEDEAVLSALKRAASSGEADLIKYGRAARNSQEVVIALRSIGAAVVLADMLKDGLLKCVTGLDAARFSADVFGGVETAPQLWSSASFAVSASLCAHVQDNFWKHADVVLRLDAHANNAHLVARAVCALLKRTQGTDDKLLRARELDLLSSFGSMILCMKRDQAKEFSDWPLRGVTLFMEKIVLYSTTLGPADLDTVMPFPLRQAAFLDRSLQRVTGHDLGFGAEEFAKRVLESAKQLAEDDAADAVEEGAPTATWKAKPT